MEAIHNLLYEDSLELLPNPTFNQTYNRAPEDRVSERPGFLHSIYTTILALLRKLTGR